MLCKFTCSLCFFLAHHRGCTVTFVFLDSHKISKRRTSHICCFLGLLLSFFLLPPLLYHFTSLATKNRHITLEIAHCRHRLQLFRENSSSIQKWGLEIVYE